MSKCPYCDITIDTSNISKLVLENTWAEIAKKCPQFSNSDRKTFNIDGHQITISEDNYTYAYIHSFINNLYNQVYKELSDYYDDYTLDTLVKNGEEFLNKKLSIVGNAILGFKYKNSGVITENDKQAYLMLMKHVEFAWAPIYTVAEEFDDLQDTLSKRRKAMKVEKTSQWVGGGFGLSGAIKGKVTADILNAGSSVANSVGNLARKAIQAGIDRSNVNKLKKEIKNSSELKNAVFTEIKQYFIDWTKTLSAIFLKDGKKFEKVEAQMLDMLDDSSDLTYLDAFEVLAKNPYNILAYSTIYYHNATAGAILSEMAHFCGIEHVVLPTFQTADNMHVNEGKIKFPNVGYDTDESELRKIKETLVGLEKNNPAYILNLPILQNENTIKEQRYHKKVDMLLALIHIEKIKKTVDQTFEKYDLKNASKMLLKQQDCYIDNFVFKEFLWILDNEGRDAFIAKFDSDIPQLATDALLVHLRKNDLYKYNSALEAVAKLGRPFPMAHYGEECYNSSEEYREIGAQFLIKAREHNCALALRYIGLFYKNGLFGFFKDADIANTYFTLAVALGDYEAKKELKQ